MRINYSGKISPYYPILAAGAIAITFILCAAIGMAINPQAFDKFWITPQTLPEFTGRSRSYYWDIASYGEMVLKPICSAFYPLWPWLIRWLWQPQTLIEAGRGFLVTATILFFVSLPLLVWVFQKSLGQRDVGFGMALLYSLSPMAIFRVNGYSEGLFGLLSLFWIGVMLPLSSLPRQHSERIGWSRWVAIGILTGLMSVTRPVLVQIVGAAIASLAMLFLFAYIQWMPTSVKETFQQYKTHYSQQIQATALLSVSAFLGYSIYGAFCWSTRGSFLAPFHDQSLWKKALGIRLELLFLPKSPLIDLLALYLPGLILVMGLIMTYTKITGQNWSKFVPRSPSWFILCLYPPALILGYGIRAVWLKSRTSRPLYSQSQQIQSQQIQDEGSKSLGENYLFWFSVYFALCHSAICFFTQNRLVSLGRYVFASPFIFLAMGYLFCRLPAKVSYRALSGLCGISALYLITQWINYGYHKWLG